MPPNNYETNLAQLLFDKTPMLNSNSFPQIVHFLFSSLIPLVFARQSIRMQLFPAVVLNENFSLNFHVVTLPISASSSSERTISNGGSIIGCVQLSGFTKSIVCLILSSRSSSRISRLPFKTFSSVSLNNGSDVYVHVRKSEFNFFVIESLSGLREQRPGPTVKTFGAWVPVPYRFQ